MAQLNTTVSDQLYEQLDLLSKITGISKSGLVEHYIRQCIYKDMEQQMLAQDFVSKFGSK